MDIAVFITAFVTLFGMLLLALTVRIIIDGLNGSGLV